MCRSFNIWNPLDLHSDNSFFPKLIDCFHSNVYYLEKLSNGVVALDYTHILIKGMSGADKLAHVCIKIFTHLTYIQFAMQDAVNSIPF